MLNKTLASSMNNSPPSEKQLLACNCAVVEAECLTVIHEVAIWPEIHIMDVVIWSPSYKSVHGK